MSIEGHISLTVGVGAYDLMRFLCQPVRFCMRAGCGYRFLFSISRGWNRTWVTERNWPVSRCTCPFFIVVLWLQFATHSVVLGSDSSVRQFSVMGRVVLMRTFADQAVFDDSSWVTINYFFLYFYNLVAFCWINRTRKHNCGYKKMKIYYIRGPLEITCI